MPQYRKLYLKTVESMDVNAMPDDFCRLMWVLLPLALCQKGRGIDNAGWIKAKLFPLRPDVTLPMIQEALEWQVARGMIRRYQVEGRPYFYIPTWHQYQGDTSRETRTHYPPPPEEGGSEEHRAHPEEHRAHPEERRAYPDEDRTCPEEQEANPDASAHGTDSPLEQHSRAPHESVMNRSAQTSMSYSCTDADAHAHADAHASADAHADAGGEAGTMGLGAGAPPISPPQLKEKRTFPSHNSQPATFQDWLDRIQEAENRQAVLREMFVMLFPGRDPPTLAKLGSFALKVGGASRLAELMWKCSARPPTGDVLAYLYGIHRHNSSGLSYRDERDVRDLEVLIHR